MIVTGKFNPMEKASTQAILNTGIRQGSILLKSDNQSATLVEGRTSHMPISGCF